MESGTDRRKGWMQLAGYYADNLKDVPNTQIQQYAESSLQSGYEKRRNQFGHWNSEAKFIYDDKPRAWFMPLVTDFTHCDQPMISGISGTLELFRADDTFTVLNGKLALNNKQINEAFTARGFRIKITRAELIIPTREMLTSLHLELENRLTSTPLLYHTLRTEICKLPLEKGLRSHILESLKNPHQKVLPDRMFIFIVADYNFNSDYGRNPYTFSTAVPPDPRPWASTTYENNEYSSFYRDISHSRYNDNSVNSRYESEGRGRYSNSNNRRANRNERSQSRFPSRSRPSDPSCMQLQYWSVIM